MRRYNLYKLAVLLCLSIILVSCKEDTPEVLPVTNETVLILKVDYLTNVFEEGRELNFVGSPTFNISWKYDLPLDFGSVELYYEELNELLFDATIIWLGSGERSFPESLSPASRFTVKSDGLDLPGLESFTTILYDETPPNLKPLEYDLIWDAIDNLEVVQEYRKHNPEGDINLYLYTPSLGVGIPAEWDWYVFLSK